MSKAAPVVTAYQLLVVNGRLKPNDAQAALVHQLGHLQEYLLGRQKSRISKNLSYSNGIYIYGGVGTGKSRIADLFTSTLPSTVSKRRVHFHEFMVDVHMRLHAARSQANFAGDPLIGIGNEIRSQSSVLCFDEFQVSDIADAMILKRLLGSFWRAGGMMISTSNRHPTELYLNGLNRALFVPFIHEMQQRCQVWKLEGDHDYRINSTSCRRKSAFFTDPYAFNEEVRKATGGQSLRPTHLKVVMNRYVTVNAVELACKTHTVKSNMMIIRGTFSELCEASLGATDYHALCRSADIIFIDGLRQFTKRELDFVRRFITLVDIAYESRTRVVCHSNVSLAQTFGEIGFVAPVNTVNAVSRLEEGANFPLSSKIHERNITVMAEGGSSSSMMSTYIDGVEWSATGWTRASLAQDGAGETDVRFAIGRAVSRLSEMGSDSYGARDDIVES